MRLSNPHQWLPLTDEGELLWLKYSFGPGTANSLAARLNDGGWAVISPPSDATASAYDALASQGEVTALVAPNGFHTLGQLAWRARFPRAVSYAPSGAAPRLAEATPTVAYRPVEELSQKLSPARFLLPAGMKAPDLLFQFPTASGNVWWLGDLFSNNSRDDQTLPLRFLSALAGSGLGFRCNSLPELVYVRDRSAWLDSIQAALAQAPPTGVIPAHGAPVTQQAAARTKKAGDALDTQRKTASARARDFLVLSLFEVGRLFSRQALRRHTSPSTVSESG